MYQYVLNLDALVEAEENLGKMADTFKDANSPEAQERTKILFHNLEIVRKAIQEGFKMKNGDPRRAVLGVVRHTDRTGRVASVDLFPSRKQGSSMFSTPSAGLDWNVGPKGVRRRITDKTLRIRNYYGSDRAFILRMLNSGTDVRIARADIHGRGSGNTYGRRGAITQQDAVAKAESVMASVAKDYGEFIVEQANKKINL